MQSNDTKINPLGYPVSSYDISLILGFNVFGNILAPIICGKLTDDIGRKNTILVIAIFNTVAFTVTAYSTSLLWILIARFTNGICFGASIITIPVFLSEITEDNNRGKIGCLMNMFLPFGQLYAYFTGLLLNVQNFTLACAVPGFLNTVLILFVPETPVHLLHKGDRISAFKSLQKYRNNKNASEIEKDLEIMVHTIEQTSKDSNGSWRSLFSHQPTRRGLFLASCLLLLQIGCGMGVLLSCMGPIFQEATTGLSGNGVGLLVGTLKFTTYFLVAHIIERSGKKPLFFVSSVFCFVTLFVLGLYFFLKERNIDSFHNYSWVAIVSVTFMTIAYGIGIGPIPLASVGELFASNIRCTALAVINLLAPIYSCALVASFPIIVEYIGVSGYMWIFSGHCLLGVLFSYFIMPETKGKSIYEIQELLKGKFIQRLW